MDANAVRRHMMPATTLVAFAAVAVPAAAVGREGAGGQLVLGAGLLLLFWAVEWLGIEGRFEGRVPRSPLVAASRAVWLAGLVIAVADTCWTHWTPWQPALVRGAGVVACLAGVELRFWSMRGLSEAFSYDLKVVPGQTLVRRGLYRWLRHPAYMGMLLWSASLALWNPSVPGFGLIVLATLVQIAHRIGEEERLLADHFGERWREHAAATWAVLPFVW